VETPAAGAAVPPVLSSAEAAPGAHAANAASTNAPAAHTAGAPTIDTPVARLATRTKLLPMLL
jgi:hypothetical protein